MSGCRTFHLVSRGKGGEGRGGREGEAVREGDECTHLVWTGTH